MLALQLLHQFALRLVVMGELRELNWVVPVPDERPTGAVSVIRESTRRLACEALLLCGKVGWSQDCLLRRRLVRGGTCDGI